MLRIIMLSVVTLMSVVSATRTKSFNTNWHQKTLKLAVYKKEETKVEEIRDEEKSLEEEYESNMRPINEKLDSKTIGRESIVNRSLSGSTYPG
jgi:hypothetical protein